MNFYTNKTNVTNTSVIMETSLLILYKKKYFELSFILFSYIHTYMPLTFFFPVGVAEAYQIFLRDTHGLPKLVSYEEHRGRDRWQAHRRLIAVYFRYKCC
jgi:hypothetical protein